MKPLSPHWADTTAVRVIAQRGDKEEYVVASGITPSGMVHIGNFREVITVDLVARALRKLGKKVRFIYSWDNFDTFRKVPENLPDPKKFEPYLRKPIARIPDPWEETESYSSGRIALFEEELKRVWMDPEYLYQESLYSQGTYAGHIRHVLESVDKVRAVLNQSRTTPLSEDWLPTSCYCSKCEKDEMHEQRYEGEWNYSYHCASCDHKETFDIRTSRHIKLGWRLDWPMRWHHEKVDFEPGGKDHSSQGGSYDTGAELIKTLWEEAAPVYQQYDFVMMKGVGGKMSSSTGRLYTLSEILSVYQPQIVRWIFAQHRPNHDFSLSFDEDVIKIYDEFDRSEKNAWEQDSTQKKWAVNRRNWELSLDDNAELPQERVYRAPFRELMDRLQTFEGDIEQTIERFYKNEIKTEADRQEFYQRSQCILHWLEHWAGEQFRFQVRKNAADLVVDDLEAQALKGLVRMIQNPGFHLEDFSTKELNEHIWQAAIHDVGCDAKKAFRVIYLALIQREKGPRLPAFLQQIGKDRLLEILAPWNE
ncbi:MAG: lysine--tRNA ligase [Oligoflexales bacterium]